MNEVRNAQERHGSIFSRSEAKVFNNFINSSNLIDLPLGGHSFTWMNKQGMKLNKLDQFLIFEDVFDLLPDIQVIALDRLCISNSIKGIMHKDVWVTDPHLVKEVFLNFFKQKFQADDSLIDFPSTTTTSRLNDCDCALLEANVSMDEVKVVV
ncbi:RNA-directed DNA polymerase, eukaryota, reverse transcriptase zinc-binding domain protein [Tanacetum coccineum]